MSTDVLSVELFEIIIRIRAMKRSMVSGIGIVLSLIIRLLIHKTVWNNTINLYIHEEIRQSSELNECVWIMNFYCCNFSRTFVRGTNTTLRNWKSSKHKTVLLVVCNLWVVYSWQADSVLNRFIFSTGRAGWLWMEVILVYLFYSKKNTSAIN